LGGRNHLPWWSEGIADLVGRNAGDSSHVVGTSMATPHIASVAALTMQKDRNLTQAQLESILEVAALALAPSNSRLVGDFDHRATISWEAICGPT
jgi:subtilisin family serine protease